jgi:hypothetical protein
MKRIAALTTCLALLIPGAAVASAKSSNPTKCSYTHTCHLSQVDHASASRTPASSNKSTSPSSVKAANATRTASTGSLPFTGLDLGALGAGAIVLLGAGMVLRRASATDRR